MIARRRLSLAGLFLLSLLLRAPDLSAPWIHNHDDEGALLSHFAANHRRLGLGETLGANDLRSGPDAASLPRVSYLHHPPLFGLLLAPIQSLLGDSEGTTRLATILLTSLLAPLAALLLPGPAGYLAGGLWAVLAGPAFYGRTPTFHVLSLPILAGLLHAIRSHRPRTISVLSFLLPWGYLPNLLLLPPLLLSDRSCARRVLLPVAIGTALVFVQIFALQGGDGIAHLLAAGTKRASVEVVWWKQLTLIGLYLPWAYLSLAAALLALVGVLATARGEREPGLDPASVLLLAGALHLLLFPQAARIHDYWSYGFWYGLVLFAGRGAAWLAASEPPHARGFTLAARGVVAVLFLQCLAGAMSSRFRMELDEPYEETFEAIEAAQALPPDALLAAGSLSPHHLLYYTDRPLAPETLADFSPVPAAYREAVSSRPRFVWDDSAGWRAPSSGRRPSQTN